MVEENFEIYSSRMPKSVFKLSIMFGENFEVYSYQIPKKFNFRLVILMCGIKPEPIVQVEFADKKYISIFEEGKDWFEALMTKDFPEKVSFASFYSRKLTQMIPKAVCVLLRGLRYRSPRLLPLIMEDIKSYAVVAHSMEQVRKLIEEVNPGQRPIWT